MNDIKEYFTANKHPLIRRSARVNHRLLATTGLGNRSIYDDVASLTGRYSGHADGMEGVSCGRKQMAGDASS